MEEIFSWGGEEKRKQVYFAIENVRLQKTLKLWVRAFCKAIKIFSKRLALLLVLSSLCFCMYTSLILKLTLAVLCIYMYLK